MDIQFLYIFMLYRKEDEFCKKIKFIETYGKYTKL
jgi:hypothetical protein